MVSIKRSVSPFSLTSLSPITTDSIIPIPKQTPKIDYHYLLAEAVENKTILPEDVVEDVIEYCFIIRSDETLNLLRLYSSRYDIDDKILHVINRYGWCITFPSYVRTFIRENFPDVYDKTYTSFNDFMKPAIRSFNQLEREIRRSSHKFQK